MKDKFETLGIGMMKDEIRENIKNLIMTSKENFILMAGGRGVGKTYTTQKTVIEYCLCNCKEFSLIVETQDAMEKGALRKWVEKVVDREFKGYQVKHTIEAFYMRRNSEEDWQRVGICIPLTKAIPDKRNSRPKCDFQIMDEALLDESMARDYHMEWFLTIYHTTDRDENRVKAILLGNTLDKVNPIYDFFNIGVKDLDSKKMGIVKRDINRVFWYIPTPPDLENDDDNIFRKMIKGTKYGDMASGLFDTEYGYMIKEPPKKLEVYCNYGIWFGTTTTAQIIEGTDGIYYAEVVPKQHLQKYCSPIFTTDYTNTTNEETIMPMWFRNMIKRELENGNFKFVDEESFLVLKSKFKMINIII